MAKFKSDSSEMQKRTTFVYGLLLQGFQRKQIIQYCAKYKISDRMIDKYIVKAREIFTKDQQVEIDIKRSEIISQYYHLYQQSYDIEDFKECKNILKEIADIIGVKAPQLLEISGNQDKPLSMGKVEMIITERKT